MPGLVVVELIEEQDRQPAELVVETPDEPEGRFTMNRTFDAEVLARGVVERLREAEGERLTRAFDPVGSPVIDVDDEAVRVGAAAKK